MRLLGGVPTSSASGGEVGATVRAVDVRGADVAARRAGWTGASVGAEINVVRLAGRAGHCEGAEADLIHAAGLVNLLRLE